MSGCDDGAGGDAPSVNINVKAPKKVLYFSDGVVEEFSEDEADSCQSEPVMKEPEIDPKSLTWGPWMKYKAWSMGSTTLAAVDYMGETLAYFFGITTPKYQMEIDEYERIERRRKKKEEESKGWVEGDEDKTVTKTQPSSSVTTV